MITKLPRDLYLVCVDCERDFIYTIEDQNFYAAQGFRPPKRCRGCRIARRQQFGGLSGQEPVDVKQ